LILNRLTFGLFEIVVTAVQEFSRLEASAAAAGIAYYALFSLFPLLLVLLSVLSFFLQEAQARAEVMRLVQDFFPIVDEAVVQLVEENLQVLISQRNSVSILGMIGLLWGGSNVFAVLAKNINQAWHIVADPLGFLKTRLVAFGIISILAALLLLSFIATIILNLVSRFSMPLWENVAVYVPPLGVGVANLLPYIFSFFLFFALYRWVPNTQVRWLEATGGALVATLTWHWAIIGFTWAISQGLVNYQVIYGSLATVVLAMFWIYFSSLIILFGAHFSAAIARHKRPREALNLNE
jgi:membrane protein